MLYICYVNIFICYMLKLCYKNIILVSFRVTSTGAIPKIYLLIQMCVNGLLVIYITICRNTYI